MSNCNQNIDPELQYSLEHLEDYNTTSTVSVNNTQIASTIEWISRGTL